MAEVTVYGFPLGTYANIVRLVLTHQGVPFDFHDLEAEMGERSHLALHPFASVPILDHAGFRVDETAAIAATRLEALPSVMTVRTMVAPHIGKLIAHARRWGTDQRPTVHQQ